MIDSCVVDGYPLQRAKPGNRHGEADIRSDVGSVHSKLCEWANTVHSANTGRRDLVSPSNTLYAVCLANNG